MVCFAIKPLSISSSLFSSGEWNHGPHLELISIDQVIVPRQLLFVKLRRDKWDLNFKAAAEGCRVRGRSVDSPRCCLRREAGRAVQGNWSLGPATQAPEVKKEGSLRIPS